jgi:hypothetical protein
MSCRQQTAPPLRDAAKMSPRISIGPEPVLAAYAPSPPAAGSHVRPEKTQTRKEKKFRTRKKKVTEQRKDMKQLTRRTFCKVFYSNK